MYRGWMKFGDKELFNAPRTKAYANALVPMLQVRGCPSCDLLGEALGDTEYINPEADGAPWFQEGDSDSAGFAGFYPLAVTGLDDDPRSATVFEGAHDGGYISMVRRTTREVRVSGILIANSEPSLEYGHSWMKMVLNHEKFGPAIGRADGDTFESQSILKDGYGSERANVRFLATCPSDDCVGDPVAHSVALGSLIPLDGTYAAGLWTPDNNYSQLRTPNVQDVCAAVEWTWSVQAADAVTASLRARRENGYVYQQGRTFRPSRTNTMRNPELGTNFTDWSVTTAASGTASGTRQTSGGPVVNGRTLNFFRMTWNTITTGSVPSTGTVFGSASTPAMTVVGGQPWSITVLARSSVANRTGQIVTTFHDASNAQVGAVVTGPAALIGEGWTELTYGTSAVPATAVRAVSRVYGVAGSAWQVNDTLDTTAVVSEPYHSTNDGYFSGADSTITDGEVSQTPAWSGTAHASASRIASTLAHVTADDTEYPSHSELSSTGVVTVNSVSAEYPDPVSVVDQTAPYWRTLRDVKCIEGPTVTQEYTKNSAFLLRIEFILAAEDPWLYSDPILIGTMEEGVATFDRDDVPFQTLDPATVSLQCYAAEIVRPPRDFNCPAVPTAPRPPHIEACSSSAVATRGALFFIPPTLIPANVVTFPIITFLGSTTASGMVPPRDNTFVRMWPLPAPGTDFDDLAACDTRGSLVISQIGSGQEFILESSRRRGAITNYSVMGEFIEVDATHMILPPKSIPAIPLDPFDPLPVEWPIMTGGGYGYYLYVETASPEELSISLELVTRR